MSGVANCGSGSHSAWHMADWERGQAAQWQISRVTICTKLAQTVPDFGECLSILTVEIIEAKVPNWLKPATRVAPESGAGHVWVGSSQSRTFASILSRESSK